MAIRLDFLSQLVGIDFWTDEKESQEINKLLKESLNFILNFIFNLSSVNVGVGHRNRINIFDFIKLIQSLRVSPKELFSYLIWSKRTKSKHTNMRKSTTIANYSKDANLIFGIDEGNYDMKRVGFEFLPPLPSSFSYKFTPIFGKRNEEALEVLKRRTEEKLKVENNLFKASSLKMNENLIFINYDEI